MGKVNVVIVDATGNKEQKVGLPDDIKCGIIMVKLIEKIQLPSVGPDGNPISYKFIHKVTGRQLLESQTLAEAGIKDGDVLRLQPEITAGAVCSRCGAEIHDGEAFCPNCGNSVGGYVPAAGYTPDNGCATPAKASKLGRICSIGGIISGFVSLIFGYMMLFRTYTGYYVSSATYGGDAYTGIQNAAAKTANNVNALCEAMRNGFGYLFIVIGLISIFYFASKLSITKENSHVRP